MITGGRGGNDELHSGSGNTHMWGDARGMAGAVATGRDTFHFSSNDGAGHGNDVIYDFESFRDKLVFHDIDLIGVRADAGSGKNVAGTPHSNDGSFSELTTSAGTITIYGVEWDTLAKAEAHIIPYFPDLIFDGFASL